MNAKKLLNQKIFQLKRIKKNSAYVLSHYTQHNQQTEQVTTRTLQKSQTICETKGGRSATDDESHVRIACNWMMEHIRWWLRSEEVHVTFPILFTHSFSTFVNLKILIN